MFIEVNGIYRKPTGEDEERPTILNTEEITAIYNDSEKDQRIIRMGSKILHVSDSYDVLKFMLFPTMFIRAKEDSGA